MRAPSHTCPGSCPAAALGGGGAGEESDPQPADEHLCDPAELCPAGAGGKSKDGGEGDPLNKRVLKREKTSAWETLSGEKRVSPKNQEAQRRCTRGPSSGSSD